MNLRLDKALTAWVNKKNCKKKTCKKSCNAPCPEEVDPCDQERYLFKSCDEPRRLCTGPKIRYSRYPSGVQGVALPLSQQPGLLESRRLSGDSYDRRGGGGPTIFVDSRFDQRRVSDPYSRDCLRRPEPELTIVRRPLDYDMIGVNPQCRHPSHQAPCDMLDNSRYDPYDYEPPILLPPPIDPLWDEYDEYGGRRRCILDPFNNNHAIRGFGRFGSRRSSLLEGYNNNNCNPYSRFGPYNQGIRGCMPGYGEDPLYGPSHFENSGYRPQNDLSKQQNNYEETRMNYDHRGSIGNNNNNNRPFENLNNNNNGSGANGTQSNQQQPEQQNNQNQNSNNNPPPPPPSVPPPPPPPIEPEHYYQPPPPSLYQVSPRPLFDIGPSGIQSRVAPPDEIVMSTVNAGGNGGGGGGNEQWNNESGDPDALLNGTTENNAHSNGNNLGNNPDGSGGNTTGTGRIRFDQGGAGGFRPGDDLLRNGFDFDNTGTSNMNNVGLAAPNDLDRFYNNNNNNSNRNNSPYNNKNGGGGRGRHFGNFANDGKGHGSGRGNKNDRDRRPPCDQSCLRARDSYCSEPNQNFPSQGPSCNFNNCCRQNEFDTGNNMNNCCTRSVCGSSAPLQQQQQQQQSQRCSCCPLKTPCDCRSSNSQSYSNPLQQQLPIQQQQQQQQCQFQCQTNCCNNGFCQQPQQPQSCLCSKCQSVFVSNDCNNMSNNNNTNCSNGCPTCNNNNGLGLQLVTDECETRRAGGTNAQYILDVLPSQLQNLNNCNNNNNNCFDVQSDNNNTDNIISSGGNNYILEECILPRTTCRVKRRARKNLSCSGGTRRQLQVLRCQNTTTTNNNNTLCNNNEDYSNCKKLIPILAISTDT